MRIPAIACLRLIAALAVGALAAAPAAAQVMSQPQAPARTLFISKGRAVPFDLPAGVAEVVVSQPETAEIVANNDTSVYVRGLEIGETNILVYDAGHRLMEVIDVNVGFDAASAQADVRSALPGEDITVRSLGGNGLVVSGSTTGPGAAARAAAIVERYAPKRVTSEIAAAGAEQIMLEVRIVEANRSALKDFGVSLDISGGGNGLLTNALVVAPVTPGTIQSGLNGASTPSGRLGISTNIGTTSIDIILDAMEEKGLIRTLARPNLAAMSGEKASFLAGGEFPFPVPNGEENVTIEFKPFGVQLEFTPTVEASGLIKLQVAPEVSQLDDSRPLRINGFNVPSMTIRRTATTVRLKDGETFAIAGLYQQEYANGVRQVPGLGDIPILGALFRSARWRRHETELVVLVTPRMQTGAQSLQGAPDPLRVANEPDAIDLLMSGRNFDQPMASPIPALRGPMEVSKAPVPTPAAGS